MAGRIMVVPKQSVTAPGTRVLGEDLTASAARFAAATSTEAAVGGPVGALGDFASEGDDAIWPVIAASAVAVLLLLVVTMRAVVLPTIAVAFDLLTAGATLGVLAFLYSGDAPSLGGPGFADPVSIIGIFAFIFGVSMMYEVLLLQRAREAFLRTGDACGAVRTGLARTAGAATGAAAVMLAAIVPFAAADLLSVQMFAIGATVAILLDALLVRPLLLPAAVALLGPRVWWPRAPRASRRLRHRSAVQAGT
jgi:putative drug exporter of the RND superfamily